MNEFLISALIVFFLAVSVWLMSLAMDGNKLAAGGLCFIVFIVFVLVINYGRSSEALGPCHKYETQMMFNSATRTMMPSRVCVLRGEWVEDEKLMRKD